MVLKCQAEYEICSHKYDPEQGDPDIGIDPGTSLKDLPDDWICPRCRVQTIAIEKREEI
ncbi:MAG: rubredoxin [Chloroflexi bacterium]|jgi:rubredoxin|nr:rubredoxin [Chloroflexota bacterium]